MSPNDIRAEIISRPGGLGDTDYPALEIQVKGFISPYVLTLALPAVAYRALAEQFDPIGFYEAIADTLNVSHELRPARIVRHRRERASKTRVAPG